MLIKIKIIIIIENFSVGYQVLKIDIIEYIGSVDMLPCVITVSLKCLLLRSLVSLKHKGSNV